MLKKIVLSTLFIGSVSNYAYAQVDHTLDGICTAEIKKNKTSLKSFKKISKQFEFEISPHQRKQMVFEFKRFIPWADQPLKYKDHQVVVFKDTVVENLIPKKVETYAEKEFKGKLYVALNYRGVKGNSKEVDIQVTLPNGQCDQIDTCSTPTIKVKDGKAIESFMGDVTFNFHDYSYSGIFGLSGWFNDEIEYSGRDSHKSKIKVTCELNSREQVNQDEQELQVEEEVEVLPNEGFVIKKNPKANAE